MSKRSTIKRSNTGLGEPGYHIYNDFEDRPGWQSHETPVHLCIDGCHIDDLATLNECPGASVALSIPRWMAREMGLLEKAK